MDQLPPLIIVGIIGVVAALGVGAFAIFAWRRSARPAAVDRLLAAQTEIFDRVGGLGEQLSEVAGRLTQATADQTTKHGELTRALNDRLDSLSQRVGSSLSDQGEKTSKAIGDLTARLRTIDAAQKNITDLSSQVVSLQDILSNKQARGAFGQGQMESIVADSLPAGAYRFQAQLSNGMRPDCLIHLPSAALAIVIDAKYPHESFGALANAHGPEATRAAQARIRADMRKHIDDISSKYLIPGETQDPAIMFLPAESIFCTVSADFFDVIEHAHRKRVAILSPNMLMLAVNMMRALMRDQKMREQAHLIQEEVLKLMKDVERLGDRADNLRQHFSLAEKDIREIEVSTGKILSRGEKIISAKMDEESAAEPAINGRRPALLAGE